MPYDFDANPIGRGQTPPEAATRPFDSAPARERVRSSLAIGIPAFTGAIGVVLLIAAWLHTNIDTLLSGIFTPFLGLAGTVLGFYFGGKDDGK